MLRLGFIAQTERERDVQQCVPWYVNTHTQTFSCHTHFGLPVYSYAPPISVASEDHTNSDCIAVSILTHGNWITHQRAFDRNQTIADTILAKDGSIKLEELTSLLRTKNCHWSLRGKPKLFFIQVWNTFI